MSETESRLRRAVSKHWRDRHPAIGALLAVIAAIAAIAALIFYVTNTLEFCAAVAASIAAVVILAIVRRFNRDDDPSPPD